MKHRSKFLIAFTATILTLGTLMAVAGHHRFGNHCGTETSRCHSGQQDCEQQSETPPVTENPNPF